MHLGHVARADGRWRLYAFADASGKALDAFCDQLASSQHPALRLATPTGADADSVFDLRAVLQTPHREVRLEDLHASLLPRKGRYGLIDYEKAFTSDASTDIFDERGIDRERGALVVVRPDQYVAHVLPLDAFAELNAFLKSIFLTDPISQNY
jgi:phenol 2-monooxygenase